jgi:hypothetical protein
MLTDEIKSNIPDEGTDGRTGLVSTDNAANMSTMHRHRFAP